MNRNLRDNGVSSDPDGNIASCALVESMFTSSKVGFTGVASSGAYSFNIPVTVADDTVLQFTWKVTDTGGLSATAEQKVVVRSKCP